VVKEFRRWSVFIQCPNTECPSNAKVASKEIYIQQNYRFCPGCGKSFGDLKIPIEYLFDQLSRARKEFYDLVNNGMRRPRARKMVEKLFPAIKAFKDW
jgi:hypothetical protein